jgi:hypothetical protein
MKTISIQHIGINSLGRLVGTWHAILGFVTSIFVAISATLSFASSTDYGVFTEVFVSIGIVLASVILIPLFAYLVGWLYGALIGLVLNVVVGTSGGIEIDVEDVKTKA